MNAQVLEINISNDYVNNKKRKQCATRKTLKNTENKIVENVYDGDSLLSINKQKFQKPFIKWVGGKTQILDKLLARIPNEFNNYREIFLGGGSVLLGILTLAKEGCIRIKGKVYAYDINEPLIYAFKNLQMDYGKLYYEINKLAIEFLKCPAGPSGNRSPCCIEDALMSRESYYYFIRNTYNLMDECAKKTVTGSALFIFLNKTCFRGMFRQGPNGFNVPYGNYKNPKIADLCHLEEIHKLIQNVEFECCDYRESIVKTQPHDFVYMDPPYMPEAANSFVGYTSNGFNMESHLTLFNEILNLSEKENVKIMLCNSDVSTIREIFNGGEYKVETFLCRRAINCKRPNSVTNEIMITNYRKYTIGGNKTK